MSKKNTLFSQLFDIYLRFIIIFISALLLFFSFVADRFVIHYNATNALNSLEKTTDSISYKLQQDINLAYALTTNETVLYSLNQFINATPAKKIEYDLIISEIFDNYWNSHPEITGIRIFIKGQGNPTPTGYRSIFYLSGEKKFDEWNRNFQEDSSVFIPEYTRGDSSYKMFHKDLSKSAIIVPIMSKSQTIGHICMDIDKYTLFNQQLNNLSYRNTSSALVYNNSNYDDTIFIETPGLSPSADLNQKIFSFPSAHRSKVHINSKTYYLLVTKPTSHNLRFMQLIPYNELTTYRVPILLFTTLLMAFSIFIALQYAKNKSSFIAQPLIVLADAMVSNSPADTSQNLSVEFSTVYNTYNNLIAENKRITNQQIKSEIQALLAQISPHFLYNTLSVIVWEAAVTEQPKICSIVSKLAKLCQLSYNFRSEFVPLETELQHIELYMQLQQECFENRFEYTIDVPNEFQTLLVPRFILQPIIENSIIHGFSQMHGSASINISASVDTNLIINISDNGSGISNDIIQKLNNNIYKTEKYGIYNINKRIKLLCGDLYSIKFASNGHNRTTVTFILPVITDAENQS